MTARHPPMPSERGSLPHFAGRLEELKQLTERLDALLAGDTTGGIQLVTGVPGVGKSELGRQFIKRLAKRRGISCLWMDVATLRSDVYVFLGIAEAMGKGKKAVKLAGLDTKIAGGSVGALSAKAQVALDHARHAPSLHGLLTSSRHQGLWRGVKGVVLLVDELQTIPPAGIANLHTLHKGDHGCPILVVGIGLQQTQDVLAQDVQIEPCGTVPGISRVAEPIALGCLSHKEARSAIAGNLKAFGYAADETCVEALAEASQGFPQHLHAYLRSAVEVLREHGHIEVGATLDEAIERGNARRTRHYQDRLRSMNTPGTHETMFPLARALEALRRSWVSERAALQLYAETEFDGQALIHDAIAHGVLTRHPDGGVGFGIPSFRSYIVGQLRAAGQGGGDVGD